MKSKIIEITAGNPNQIKLDLARQLGMQGTESDMMEIPEALGKGYFKIAMIGQGILVCAMEYNMRQDLIVRRVPNPNSHFYPIFYYYSDGTIQQLIDKDLKDLGGHTPFGVFMASPHIGAKIKIPSNVKVGCVTIGVSRDWLIELMTENDILLTNRIRKNIPFFFYEPLDLTMKLSIEVLLENFQSQPDNLMVKAKALELVGLFLKRLQSRNKSKWINTLQSRDIESLFLIKKRLFSDLANFPSITVLAQDIGMSESSLQKKFRLVFGKSIYQYQLAAKMEEAARLIQSCNYTISEIGHQMGYSNLSRFTEAFKKHFGCKPSHYNKA